MSMIVVINLTLDTDDEGDAASTASQLVEELKRETAHMESCRVIDGKVIKVEAAD